MAGTGYITYKNRRLIFSDDQSSTGTEEPNTEFEPDGVTPDPNFIAKVQDLISCPLSGLKSFLLSTQTANDNTICNTISSSTKFHNGIGSFPVIGDTVYITNDANNPLPGGSTWYKVLIPNLAIQISSGNSIGLVINLVNC